MTGFIDTNLLVYCFQSDDGRCARATALLDGTNLIGVQSLNEFALVARRRLSFEWTDVQRALTAIRALAPSPIPLTLDIHESGVRIAERYQFRIYDSLLLAAALSARCNTFWSEDMHDGHVVEDRLTIRDPFA